MAKKKALARGLDGRQRDHSGSIRRKRSDTLVGTLRLEYGEGFLPGYRASTKLVAVLKKEGAASLHEILRRKKK